MLIQRVLTALVLLPLVLSAAWYAPLPWLYGLFSAAGLIAAWEWAPMTGTALRTSRARLGYVALSALVLAVVWPLRGHWQIIDAVALLWWLLALALLPGFPDNLQKHRPSSLLLAVLGQLLWPPAILSLVTLRGMPEGALRLIYVFFLIWAADVGAYLAGRNFGRTKLAPQVSPGKTREGAAGGLLLCGLWSVVAGTYVFGIDSAVGLAKILVLSLATAALSIAGDLTISMFKRLSGIKDSGTLLPGHGGILDRIDSLLSAAPLMALGLYGLGL